MSDTIISPSDAGLLLHKWVTEAVPIIGYFVSGDGSRTAQFKGFVQSTTQREGLVIGTDCPFPRPKSLLAYMRFSYETLAASSFTYADETGVPKDATFGSGLCIHFPNGDKLTIVETKDSHS